MGRKKKEEKKEYLYKNVSSIVFVFLGILFVIASLQPQNTYLKNLLNSNLGYSSIFFGLFILAIGLYFTPLLNIKFINKSFVIGFFFTFLSFILFSSFTGSYFISSFIGGLFNELVGNAGTLVIAIMFLLLGVYLVFNTKFTTFIKKSKYLYSIFAHLISIFRKFSFNKSSKVGEKDSTLTSEEDIFDLEKVNDDTPFEYSENKSDSDVEKEEIKDDFSLVESLSEPVSLLKSNIKKDNFFKSTVSSIGNSSVSEVKESTSLKNKDAQLPKDIKENSSNLPFRNNIWEYPPLTLLNDQGDSKADTGNTKKRAQIIEDTLASFGIKSKIVSINPGPTVTQYALKVAEGTKTSRITNLQGDLALALASPNGQVRIEAPIPGKSLIGIEVPNLTQEFVFLKNMLNSSDYKKNKDKSSLTICLGKDVGGNNTYYPINKMPHVLIAGATGSGKSIMIHSIISTLLFANSPDECKFIMVDPKRVELVNYNNIPHLITPVITDTNEAINALKWIVDEMERRLKVLSEFGVRNIDSYNEKSGFQAMPYIVVVLDELADLMMTSSNDVEKHIVRIAQLSRATGIHLVLATQRPSTDIITGSIKANVPARIAFNVASQVDSRVIIDSTGAEKLLGKGDMLFVSPESSKPVRIQGVFLHDEEVNRLVNFLKASDVKPDYDEQIVTSKSSSPSGEASWEDELFPEAVKETVEYGRGSASLLQRRLSIGYARAARLLDELEDNGVVSPKDGSKPREVLISDPEEILG